MTAKKKLFVNFDGLCEPANPAGIPCYGFVVKNENATVSYRGDGLVNSVKPFSPQANSNAAEYGSAIKAMEWLVENGYANDNDDYEILVRRLSIDNEKTEEQRLQSKGCKNESHV
jgi:ribonuclease HI